MDFKQYERSALATAVYPGTGTNIGLFYVGLKLNGEAGEFAEHLGKALRDEEFHLCPLTHERHALLKKELGDVLWYLAAAARELGTTLEQVAADNIKKLQDRKDRGVLQGSGDER